MFRKSTFVVLAVFVVFSVGFVFAVEQSGGDALGKLMDGNKRFVAGSLTQKANCQTKRQELVAGQHPAAIVVACSDSRVAPEVIFDQFLGDVFVVRVAGTEQRKRCILR